MTRDEKINKEVFQFDKDFEGNVIPCHMGRLSLGKGSLVRIIFTSEGLKFVISAKAKKSGEIIWLKPSDKIAGLGLPIKK